MIFGIVSVIFFIMICMRFIIKYMSNKKLKLLFIKLHVPVSIMFAFITVLHCIASFPIMRSRSVYSILTGFLSMIFIFLSFLSGLQMRKGKQKLRQHQLCALAACFLIIIHIVFNITGLVAYQNKVQNISIDPVDIAEIPDGIYVGECDVTYIFVKVEVTVVSGSITEIAILEHRNERGKSAEIVVDNILDQQRIDVDAVTSATNSSIVIKKAVENALGILDNKH